MPAINSLLNSGKKHFSSSSGGSSIVLILIIIVVVFAVMMSGGTSHLFSGNLPSSVTGTPIPDNNSGSTSPTTSPQVSPTPAGPVWSIKDTPGECTTENGQTLRKDIVTATGPSGGYIELDLKNSDNSYTIIETHSFLSPILSYVFVIPSSQKINTSSWRISIYQGGNVNNNVWSNGTLKDSEDENPTGC